MYAGGDAWMSKATKHRTQIYLNEREYQYLKQQAEKEGSIAKVIRNLIDEKLKVPENYKDDPFYKWVKKPIKTGISDLAAEHDKYLYSKGKKWEPSLWIRVL